MKKIIRKSRFLSQFLESYFIRRKYLRKKGWFESKFTNIPMDADGSAIPWFTYASIHFLKNRMEKHFSVFEYGSGQSTIWFSDKVKRVVSLEHDLNFHNFLKPKLAHLNNVSLIYEPLENDKYNRKILNYQNEFQIVVIDGRDRIKCVKNALKSLTDNGIIIWDNSDRSSYNEGYDFLIQNGFKRLDFWSMGPINHFEWCTSIFYRNNNCLNL